MTKAIFIKRLISDCFVAKHVVIYFEFSMSFFLMNVSFVQVMF